jgi:Ca2+-binding RTX toxin-like protein
MLPDGKLLIVNTHPNPLPVQVDPPPSKMQFIRLLGVGDSSPPADSLDTASGVLSINGTADDDTIEVSQNLSGIEATNRGVGRAFNSDGVNRIDIDAGAGDDIVSVRFLSDKPAHVRGGAGRDRIAGGPMNDTLEGNAQRDRIDGGGGDDLIVGNGGNDAIRGEDGNDSLGGGRGNDHLDGGTGDDHLEGGPGRDLLHGGDGNDSLAAADGEIDQLFGDAGTDSASADPDDILSDIESVTP